MDRSVSQNIAPAQELHIAWSTQLLCLPALTRSAGLYNFIQLVVPKESTEIKSGKKKVQGNNEGDGKVQSGIDKKVLKKMTMVVKRKMVTGLALEYEMAKSIVPTMLKNKGGIRRLL